MTFFTFLLIGILCIIISILVIGSWYIITHKVLISYHKKITTPNFVELLEILQSIIKLELELYENDIFKSRITITNSNFENYLKELSTKIYHNLSQEFFEQMEHFVTRDMIIQLIARTVKNFLLNKINGTIE